MTDLVFRWPARQYAAAHQGRTWVYEFDWRSLAVCGELGACHGMELPFVFKTLGTVTGEQGLAWIAPPQDLANRIHAIWVGFATDGTLPWGQFDGRAGWFANWKRASRWMRRWCRPRDTCRNKMAACSAIQIGEFHS